MRNGVIQRNGRKVFLRELKLCDGIHHLKTSVGDDLPNRRIRLFGLKASCHLNCNFLRIDNGLQLPLDRRIRSDLGVNAAKSPSRSQNFGLNFDKIRRRRRHVARFSFLLVKFLIKFPNTNEVNIPIDPSDRAVGGEVFRPCIPENEVIRFCS